MKRFAPGAATVPGPAAIGIIQKTGRPRATRTRLLAYRSRAATPDLAVPTTEHFDPLFCARRPAFDGERTTGIYEGFRYGNLSMRSFLFSAGVRVRRPGRERYDGPKMKPGPPARQRRLRRWSAGSRSVSRRRGSSVRFPTPAAKPPRISDVDLLDLFREVEEPHQARWPRCTPLLIGFARLPKDIVVSTTARFERYRNVVNTVYWPAARAGRILYERAA